MSCNSALDKGFCSMRAPAGEGNVGIMLGSPRNDLPALPCRRQSMAGCPPAREYQSVFPDLVAQAIAGDAQQAGGERLVAARSFQGAHGEPLLASAERKILVRPVATGRRAEVADLVGEAGERDLRGVLHHHGALHGVAQLANVAGPGVAQQGGGGLLGELSLIHISEPTRLGMISY